MSSASIKLYYFPLSAPCRGALLAARSIGVPVQIEIVNLFRKDQLKEEFSKVNPQHCVPTLDDDGFIIWESRAISGYLADKYGKDDQLYPKDLKRRTVVNQRLYFDSSNLYVKIRAICFPILYQGVTEIKETLKNDLNVTLGFLDGFLSNSKWVAGNNTTIADTSIYASISNILARWIASMMRRIRGSTNRILKIIAGRMDSSILKFWAIGWDISTFPNIQRWVQDCATLPGYEENQHGAEQFGEAVKKNLKH